VNLNPAPETAVLARGGSSLYKIINKKKLLATVILDACCKLLFAVPNAFRRPGQIDPEQINSILIVRTAYIGDVVMTLPIIKLLKAKIPQARITFLTSHSALPLLANNPHLAAVLAYDPFWFYKTGLRDWLRFLPKLRDKHYDLVIETRADIRDLALIAFFCKARYKLSYAVGGGASLLSHVVDYPGLTHKVDYHLHLASYLGCRLDDLDGGLYLSAEELLHGQSILAAQGVTGQFIAVHPGSRLFLKRWPLPRCAELCDKLASRYRLPIVFVGAAGEIPLVEHIQAAMAHDTISLAGQLSLRELAALLRRATIFICNDSAPMHIAAAMRTATVAIFGPSKSRETGPYGVVCRVVEKEMACRITCDESHCQFSRFHACMEDISVDMLLTAVNQLLETEALPPREVDK
jgi:lipopolysaccharide heptosyltransferase II